MVDPSLFAGAGKAAFSFADLAIGTMLGVTLSSKFEEKTGESIVDTGDYGINGTKKIEFRFNTNNNISFMRCFFGLIQKINNKLGLKNDRTIYQSADIKWENEKVAKRIEKLNILSAKELKQAMDAKNKIIKLENTQKNVEMIIQADKVKYEFNDLSSYYDRLNMLIEKFKTIKIQLQDPEKKNEENASFYNLLSNKLKENKCFLMKHFFNQLKYNYYKDSISEQYNIRDEKYNEHLKMDEEIKNLNINRHHTETINLNFFKNIIYIEISGEEKQDKQCWIKLIPIKEKASISGYTIESTYLFGSFCKEEKERQDTIINDFFDSMRNSLNGSEEGIDFFCNSTNNDDDYTLFDQNNNELIKDLTNNDNDLLKDQNDQILKVGDSVMRRDRGQKWSEGIITSLQPLKVSYDTSDEIGYEWHEITLNNDKKPKVNNNYKWKNSDGIERNFTICNIFEFREKKIDIETPVVNITRGTTTAVTHTAIGAAGGAALGAAIGAAIGIVGGPIGAAGGAAIGAAIGATIGILSWATGWW